MEINLNILKFIEKNNNTTQRDISRKTGMSLGSVNILIKQLVKKGLLKVEKLSPRTIQYILTPEGLKEKFSVTYNYIVNSYRYINEVNLKIDELLKELVRNPDKHIVLFGNNDEICQILQGKLEKTPLSCSLVSSIDELQDMGNQIFLVWHPDYAESLTERKIKFINLLDII